MTQTHVTAKGSVVVGSDAAEVIKDLLAALKALHDAENMPDRLKAKVIARAAIAKAESR